MADLVVVKVGGSLFDHPRLGPGLRAWAAREESSQVRFVPGGGPAADVVRQYHRTHVQSEEFSHWLAIHMMDINGRLLWQFLQTDGFCKVLDIHDFCRHDEESPLRLPHTWKVTSDAIAARIAEDQGAAELVLLKSVNLPDNMDWTAAAREGLVDWAFGEVIERSGLSVRWVNFRAQLDAAGVFNPANR